MPQAPSDRSARVAVVYNADYLDVPASSPGFVARADVASVATEVARALAASGHATTLLAVDGDLERMRQALVAWRAHAVFNLCESLAGDARLESAVPLVLEGMKLPYTGSPPAAISTALYKDRVKACLVTAKIATPRTWLGTQGIRFPVMVKPVHEDGSAGISKDSVVRNVRDLRRRIAAIQDEFHQGALVEEFIDGREFNVAILGARVLPIQEIDFGELARGAPRIVTYDAKWTVGSAEDLGTRPVVAATVPSDLAARVRRAAKEAFRAVGLRDYGRVDVRVDRRGVPFVIDVNPNCDLAQAAGFARAAQATGIDYVTLVAKLASFALTRRLRNASRARAASSRR